MLGENAAATHLQHRRLLRETRDAVEALPDSAPLPATIGSDRRGLHLAHVRTGLFFNERETWRTNPQVHCDAAVQAIFGLVVRHAERLERAVAPIEARLTALPQFLAQGAALRSASRFRSGRSSPSRACGSRDFPFGTRRSDRASFRRS